MNRRFYLIDRENDNKKIRITMKTIVDHFVGDGTGPVRWNCRNVDLERFRKEMDEIRYTFVVELGPSAPSSALSRLRSLERQLKTAENKLQELRDNRPRDKQSDRACRRYMERFFFQQHKVESLLGAVKSAKEQCLKNPLRERRS